MYQQNIEPISSFQQKTQKYRLNLFKKNNKSYEQYKQNKINRHENSQLQLLTRKNHSLRKYSTNNHFKNIKNMFDQNDKIKNIVDNKNQNNIKRINQNQNQNIIDIYQNNINIYNINDKSKKLSQKQKQNNFIHQNQQSQQIVKSINRNTKQLFKNNINQISQNDSQLIKMPKINKNSRQLKGKHLINKRIIRNTANYKQNNKSLDTVNNYSNTISISSNKSYLNMTDHSNKQFNNDYDIFISNSKNNNKNDTKSNNKTESKNNKTNVNIINFNKNNNNNSLNMLVSKQISLDNNRSIMVHKYSNISDQQQGQQSQSNLYTYSYNQTKDYQSHNKHSSKINNITDCYYISNLISQLKQIQFCDQNSQIPGILQHFFNSLDVFHKYKSIKIPIQPHLNIKVNNNNMNNIKKKITLIFDMDQTLIHAQPYVMEKHKNDKFGKNVEIRLDSNVNGTSNSNNINTNKYNNNNNNNNNNKIMINLKIRPFAIETLKSLKQDYQIGLFTAASEFYARGIIKLIDPNNQIFDFLLFRQHCYFLQNKITIKDLRILSNRRLQNMILIDNTPSTYLFQLNNGIPIVSFIDDQNDNEMIKLQQFLKQNKMERKDDIRNVLKKKFKLDKKWLINYMLSDNQGYSQGYFLYNQLYYQ